ncbi:hypothetical protein FRC10_005846, partial [Ceratobasidium sp. 414]
MSIVLTHCMVLLADFDLAPTVTENGLFTSLPSPVLPPTQLIRMNLSTTNSVLNITIMQVNKQPI